MTLEEVEAWSGVKGSTWSYAETEGKGISSKILEALSKAEPPEGKSLPRMLWLTSGDEPKFQFTKEELLGAAEKMREPKAGDSFRWMAEKATAGALAERGLDATAEQREFLASHLAHSAAAGATPERLQRELNSYLDLLQATKGRREPK